MHQENSIESNKSRTLNKTLGKESQSKLNAVRSCATAFIRGQGEILSMCESKNIQFGIIPHH